jgi:glycerol uptake facilitator-like aquaporin
MGGDALACVWVFIAGPLIGALVAAIIWKIIKPQENSGE